MADFVAEKEKELSICKMLLRVRSATKKLKGEEFCVDNGQVQLAEATIAECKQLWEAFVCLDPDFGGNYLIRFHDKADILTKLIENLKNLTNFFGNKMNKEILTALEKATTKFLKVAE